MVVPDQLRSLDADQMSDKSSMRFLQSRTVEEERAWDINKLDDILNNPDVRNAKFEKWVGKKYKMKDITTKIQAITSVDEKYLRIPLLYGVHSGQISSKMLPKVRYK
ncbi:hypothetical protein PRIC1_003375 [Phytophthora ramorum]|nr:hypothetical protein KRP22_6976 [Phytophthora ramorum]